MCGVAFKNLPVPHKHQHHFPLHYSTNTTSSPTSIEVSTTNTRLKDLLSSIVNAPTKAADISLAHHLHELSVLLLDTSQDLTAQACQESVLLFKLGELQESGMEEVEEQARLCLALLGHAPPYSGRGLRILSIDGGGTR